jgi:hypothetical protein
LKIKKEGKMKKSFMVLFLAFLIVGLISASAFAAAQLNAGNTTLSAEKIPPTTDYPASFVYTAYQTGGPVARSTVIKISLTNGKFAGNSTIYICNGSTPMGSGTVLAAPNNNYVEITLNSPLASGTVYTFQHDGCADAGTPLNNVIRVPAGSVAGTVISMTVDNKLTPGDPNVYATAPVITVKNQFSATLLPVTSKLDFNDNMETFIPDSSCTTPPCTTATESKAALLIVSDESINDKVTLAPGGGTCDRQLAANDLLTAKITGNLQGISAVKYEGVSTITHNVTSTDITNGYATLTVAGNSLRICRSTDTPKIYRALELTAANTAGIPIIAGTRTAQITIKGGGTIIPAGYTRDLIPAGTPSHIIQLDATQYYIPLIKVATGEDTYIKLQSKSTIGGANGVSIQILASDGSLVTYNAGTITPGTPLTITGSQLVSAVTSAGKTVDGSKGFAAIVTINAPEGDVFAYANICNVSGCKRIPVKTVNGNIVE